MQSEQILAVLEDRFFAAEASLREAREKRDLAFGDEAEAWDRWCRIRGRKVVFLKELLVDLGITIVDPEGGRPRLAFRRTRGERHRQQSWRSTGERQGTGER